MNDLLEFCKENFRYENGNLLRLKSRGAQKKDSICGWTTICNGKNYKKINVNYKTYYLHQIIFLLHHGYIPKVIDHIDRDSLNNKIENLRACTQIQNCGNRSKNKNNTSGYKGVTYLQKHNKYYAQIHFQGKHYHIGQFDHAIDASEAYEKAALEKFGKFACNE